jgi:hypothetical protein
VNRFDVLVTLLGSPHESDSISTALSLVEAMLERRARVSVWACGNATFLTSDALSCPSRATCSPGTWTIPPAQRTSVTFWRSMMGVSNGQFAISVATNAEPRHISEGAYAPCHVLPRFVKNADKTLTVGRL